MSMAENTNAAGAKSSNGFVTLFLPGLLLGLVMGGVAGAFLAPLADAPAKVSAPAGGGAVRQNNSGPRDSVPTPAEPVVTPESAETKPADVKPADVKPAENKPADVKPAETKPVEPVKKP
jgi:hypothetical protein